MEWICLETKGYALLRLLGARWLIVAWTLTSFHFSQLLQPRETAHQHDSNILLPLPPAFVLIFGGQSERVAIGHLCYSIVKMSQISRNCYFFFFFFCSVFVCLLDFGSSVNLWFICSINGAQVLILTFYFWPRWFLFCKHADRSQVNPGGFSTWSVLLWTKIYSLSHMSQAAELNLDSDITYSNHRFSQIPPQSHFLLQRFCAAILLWDNLKDVFKKQQNAVKFNSWLFFIL